MARSLKKGYFVNPSLSDKVEAAQKAGSHKPIKSWARNSTITPECVGREFLVHNGKTFISVRVTENMVGHKFGEFALTRTFKGHPEKTQKGQKK